MSAYSPESNIDSRPWRHGRRSIYLVFVVLAALAVLQAVYAHRFERARVVDTDLISLVGSQRASSQQMGRIAALVGGAAPAAQVHAESLARALEVSGQDASRLEAEIARQTAVAAEAMPEISAALSVWQLARKRLHARSQDLLRALGEADRARVAAAAAAVQLEVEPAVAAGAALTEQLQEAAREHSQGQLRWLEGGVGLTLALLGLLSIFAVEPTARSMQAQQRRLALQAAQLQRLALVVARTSNLVVVTDAERRIEWVNDAFTRLTGYSSAEVQGVSPGSLLHAESSDAQIVNRIAEAVSAGDGIRSELRMRTKSGGELWIDADIQPLCGEDGLIRGFVTLGNDITERRHLEAQLSHLACPDALTGLPQRAVVLDRVQRAIHHAQRHPGYGFAVLFMDCDRFRQVNDTLGHAAGDELLRQIARRIEEVLRPGDAVARVASELRTAARIGGDEFVIVLEGTHGGEEARLIAMRLLETLAEPYTVRGHAVHSSASIGIVTSERAAATAGEVLRDADTAMYEAKRAGRGRCVVFDDEMHERVVQALQIESELRRALKEGEIFVVYQPVVRLNDQSLAGVEALVRWRHPTRGVVPPSQFIGIAEEAGLMDAIGQEVLQLACRQFAAWRQRLGARAPPELAVNLSRAQLRLPGLAPEVKWVLEQHGMQPHELQFEITESLAAQDKRVQVTLGELKTLGVKLALDDFGTGYSSLACLHQLPVDTVKIDRSFVSHAEGLEYHRVLIEATIRVAQTLGMATVAEGIESEGQAALMKELHCERGQGYLFGRPMSADDLEAWIGQRQEADTGVGV